MTIINRKFAERVAEKLQESKQVDVYYGTVFQSRAGDDEYYSGSISLPLDDIKALGDVLSNHKLSLVPSGNLSELVEALKKKEMWISRDAFEDGVIGFGFDTGEIEHAVKEEAGLFDRE